MPRHIEVNPSSHFTIGTQGDPGKRTFYMQGGITGQLVTLVMEKQQAQLLVNGLESLLDELQKKFSKGQSSAPTDKVFADLRLREPIEPLFRIGNMGLGYNEEMNRIVLVAYELVEEEDEPNVVSFWVTHAQLQPIIPHIREVVRAGRPICGNCGQPIDAEGHFCPHRNGHRI